MRDNFDIKHFILENKIDYRNSILEEDFKDLKEELYDSDDFIPYEDVQPNMVAVDQDGERFRVIEKLDGERVRCSLEDDPRDIETVKYGNMVMCHYSDQQDMDESQDLGYSTDIDDFDTDTGDRFVRKISNRAARKAFFRDPEILGSRLHDQSDYDSYTNEHI